MLRQDGERDSSGSVPVPGAKEPRFRSGSLTSPQGSLRLPVQLSLGAQSSLMSPVVSSLADRSYGAYGATPIRMNGTRVPERSKSHRTSYSLSSTPTARLPTRSTSSNSISSRTRIASPLVSRRSSAPFFSAVSEDDDSEYSRKALPSIDAQLFQENARVLNSTLKELKQLRESQRFAHYRKQQQSTGAHAGDRGLESHCRLLLAVSRVCLDLMEADMLPQAVPVQLGDPASPMAADITLETGASRDTDSDDNDSVVSGEETKPSTNADAAIPGGVVHASSLLERLKQAEAQRPRPAAKQALPRALSFSLRDNQAAELTAQLERESSSEQRRKEAEDKEQRRKEWTRLLLQFAEQKAPTPDPRITNTSTTHALLWPYFSSLLSANGSNLNSGMHPFAATVQSFALQAAHNLSTIFTHYTELLSVVDAEPSGATTNAVVTGTGEPGMPPVDGHTDFASVDPMPLSSTSTPRKLSGQKPVSTPSDHAPDILLTPTSLSTRGGSEFQCTGQDAAVSRAMLLSELDSVLRDQEKGVGEFIRMHCDFVIQFCSLSAESTRQDEAAASVMDLDGMRPQTPKRNRSGPGTADMWAIARRVCLVAVESAVLAPLQPYLLPCYALYALDKDSAVDTVVRHFEGCTPADVGVPQFLRLNPKSAPDYTNKSRIPVDSTEANASDRNSNGSLSDLNSADAHGVVAEAEPYDTVIRILQGIPHASGGTKTDLLVAACQAIPETVASFYHHIVDRSELSVTSDELIPLLSYCLIKAKLHRIATELEFMKRWTDDNSLMGEHGYCLTTLECCIDYLIQLQQSQASDVPDHSKTAWCTPPRVPCLPDRKSELNMRYSLAAMAPPLPPALRAGMGSVQYEHRLGAPNGVASHAMSPSGLIARATAARPSLLSEQLAASGPAIPARGVADVIGTQQLQMLGKSTVDGPSMDLPFVDLLEPTPRRKNSGSSIDTKSTTTESAAASGIFQRLADESVAKLLAAVEDQEAWTYEHEVDGVQVYRKKEEEDLTSGFKALFGRPEPSAASLRSRKSAVSSDTGINAVMGKGLIKAEPVQLSRLMREVNNRTHYDDMCVDARLVQRIDQNTWISHMMFAGKKWCTTQYRDFCVLSHSRRLDDGSYIITGRSVRHKQCPEDASGKFLRGRVHFSGWVLRPVPRDSAEDSTQERKSDASAASAGDASDGTTDASEDASSEPVNDLDPVVPDLLDLAGSVDSMTQASPECWCDVTYVVQCDVGGIAPTWVKNLIASKQPLIIRDLRDFFADK